MSFTRVEQDGVEFYTLKSNGASGMSISGLARLCGVSDTSVLRILNSIALHSVRSNRLKRFSEKDLYLCAKGPKGAVIIRAEVCSAIIRYYAIESEAKTETALYSYDKFADIGMEKWIQGITGWTPEIASIEITPELFEKYLTSRRKGIEFEIQYRMHKELGGKMEVYTPIGPIDLVTKTEAIEIKKIEDWKEALGQVIAKGQSFPKHTKRIHLFGESSKHLKKITHHCRALDVLVTFETVVRDILPTLMLAHRALASQ